MCPILKTFPFKWSCPPANSTPYLSRVVPLKSASLTPSGIYTAVTVAEDTASSANNSNPNALTAATLALAALW